MEERVTKDLNWLISEERHIARAQNIDDVNMESYTGEMTLGICGIRPYSENTGLHNPLLRAITSSASSQEQTTYLKASFFRKTELLLAQHLFANFMWSISDLVQPKELSKSIAIPLLGFDSEESSTWRNCKIQSETLSTLVGNLQNYAAELDTEDSIGHLIIPSLSWHNLLPYHSLAELIVNFPRLITRCSLLSHRQNAYSSVERMANGLLTSLTRFCESGASEKFICTIVAATEEARADVLLLLAPFNASQEFGRITWMGDWMKMEQKVPMKEKHRVALSRVSSAIHQVDVLYRWQRRTLYPLHETEADTTPSVLRESQRRRVFGYGDWHVSLVSGSGMNTNRCEDTCRMISSHILALDILGWTSLDYAVACKRWSTVTEIAQELLHWDLDAPKDFTGRTPLHYAAMESRYDNPAVDPGRDKALQHLISLKGSTIKDRCGMTPLHWAARSGNSTNVLLFLEDDDSQDKYADVMDRTAFHWAAFSGDLDSLKALTSAGLDTTAGDQRGDTPLHYAAWRDNYDAVVYLLSRTRADPHTKNNDNLTAEAIARSVKGRRFLKTAFSTTLSLLQDAKAQIEKHGAYDPLQKKGSDDMDIADREGTTNSEDATDGADMEDADEEVSKGGD
ncbi:ankyrin [Lophiostoma macrostomum CBS 122681]|uniref:Ankyrin n=1 Tax=Lophiostoma macrostomum CBS 122681 TaxID=1314788 RepID=A0A6A6STL2_9PLEO|nr:ankyrin [Lophiostoma macrostomum CBS 122681]